MKHLLEVEGLGVQYHSGTAWHSVLEDVSFAVAPGEIVGVIGESGCGKSTLAKAILGLMPPGGRVVAGQVRLEGQNLVGFTESQYRQVRWRRIAMVFQSAMNALNPMYRVGNQIAEPIVATGTDGRRAALQRAGELLELVGVPRDRVTAYPHELSGGMRQRVCIAMALALNPKLILADEPTTALDVVTQERILDLLKKLRDTLGISVILISHDLSVIAEACDQVVVLYGGRVVERGPSQSVLHRSFHPYTMGLRNAFPELDSDQTLVAISGHPPVPGERHAGCVFAPRCPFAVAACHDAEPALVQAEPGHDAACPVARERRSELAQLAGRPETWRTGVAV